MHAQGNDGFREAYMFRSLTGAVGPCGQCRIGQADVFIGDHQQTAADGFDISGLYQQTQVIQRRIGIGSPDRFL